jgi:hypothetical protein
MRADHPLRQASAVLSPLRVSVCQPLGFVLVTGSFDPVAYNRAAWDREVESGSEWTRPVGPEVIARARADD